MSAMRVLLISANTERSNIVPLPLGLNYVNAATDGRRGQPLTKDTATSPAKQV
jgi:hypothetical protein